MLTAWDRIQICRHPGRPRSTDFIAHLFTDFLPLAGDRAFGDDPAIIGGFATIQGKKCMVVGQEKGKDTASRLKHNFGMAHPEGYRKALRLMKLAEKFSLPIVTLVDTPGAFPGLEAEERGQGFAIAQNLREMMRIEVPILSIIIGEGCSGGALGIAVADQIAMFEHAYYSVISPEGCASILWKEKTKSAEAAEALKLHAEDLLRFGVIDTILKEAEGGAHLDPSISYEALRAFLVANIAPELPLHILLENRYQKFRKMGSVQ